MFAFSSILKDVSAESLRVLVLVITQGEGMGSKWGWGNSVTERAVYHITAELAVQSEEKLGTSAESQLRVFENGRIAADARDFIYSWQYLPSAVLKS